jgi:hypothetical protein
MKAHLTPASVSFPRSSGSSYLLRWTVVQAEQDTLVMFKPENPGSNAYRIVYRALTECSCPCMSDAQLEGISSDQTTIVLLSPFWQTALRTQIRASPKPVLILFSLHPYIRILQSILILYCTLLSNPIDSLNQHLYTLFIYILLLLCN